MNFNSNERECFFVSKCSCQNRCNEWDKRDHDFDKRNDYEDYARNNYYPQDMNFGMQDNFYDNKQEFGRGCNCCRCHEREEHPCHCREKEQNCRKCNCHCREQKRCCCFNLFRCC